MKSTILNKIHDAIDADDRLRAEAAERITVKIGTDKVYERSVDESIAQTKKIISSIRVAANTGKTFVEEEFTHVHSVVLDNVSRYLKTEGYTATVSVGEREAIACRFVEQYIYQSAKLTIHWTHGPCSV
ncbi:MULTISPECIES: hypothetical protein [Rosenbergiella]|uniref:hypothetical protein n=1 Tax=Rosenbergiella TaxID=1356488 RepID=UPI001F4F2025|nr:MULTISPECIES: hypothetical protein [Rosenbergiella]